MDEEWSQQKLTYQETFDEVQTYMKDLEHRLKVSAIDTSAKVTALSWKVDDLEKAATVPTGTDPRPPPEAHEEAKDSESVENYFRQEANQARAEDYDQFAQQNIRRNQPSATRSTPRPTSKTTSTTPATTPPESPLDELEEEANGSDPVDDYY